MIELSNATMHKATQEELAQDWWELTQGIKPEQVEYVLVVVCEMEFHTVYVVKPTKEARYEVLAKLAENIDYVKEPDEDRPAMACVAILGQEELVVYEYPRPKEGV